MDKSPHHFYSTGGRKIGCGQCGKVFESVQTKPETKPKKVALKVVQESAISSREATTMASLPPHPNVCKLFDTWVLDGKRYIAMELIDGITLREWLDALDFDDPIDWRKIISIFLQIFSGIAHLHEHRIFHGDIKPANIMIIERDDGTIEIKIIDLGFSSHFDSIPQQPTGSPMYSSPEVANEQGIDGSSDLWAVGVIILEFCSEGWQKPWFLRDAQTKSPHDVFQCLKSLNYSTSPFPAEYLQHENPIVAFFAGIAQRCLALDKSERPRAQDVVTELTAKLAELRDA
jgi:serine/threonine protein kinase